jgi:hypothetical protein
MPQPSSAATQLYARFAWDVWQHDDDAYCEHTAILHRHISNYTDICQQGINQNRSSIGHMEDDEVCMYSDCNPLATDTQLKLVDVRGSAVLCMKKHCDCADTMATTRAKATSTLDMFNVLCVLLAAE